MSDFEDEMMADPFYSSMAEYEDALFIEFQEEQYGNHKTERELEDY